MSDNQQTKSANQTTNSLFAVSGCVRLLQNQCQQWVLNSCTRLMLLIWSVLLLAPVQAQFRAQIQFPGERNGGGEASDAEALGVFPYDRNLSNIYDRCKRMLDQKNYADGLEGLDALLAQEKDSALKQVRGKEKYQSIKREALSLIGTLPPEGLAAYRLQFGATANKALVSALASGNPDELSLVVRRYYHTEAGYQAALLLGRHQLDHGQILAAAQLFQGLFDTPNAREQLGQTLVHWTALAWHRAGQSSRAAEVLAKATEFSPQSKFAFAGKPVPSNAKPADLLTWVTANLGPIPQSTLVANKQWAMFRGNSTRNASMTGGSPLMNPRWYADVVSDSQLGLRLHNDRKGYLNQGVPAVPALQALAVDKYIMFRTPNPQQPLVAVDFESGKLSWFYGQSAMSGTLAQTNQAFPVNPVLSERAWSNMNYGGLSSDGQRVFFVEDDSASSSLGVTRNLRQQRMQVRWGGPFGGNNQGNEGNFQPSNRLYACDIASQGKLQWVIGGFDSEMEPQLAGATFLGAPLPLNGTLYLIAEIKQAINLVAVNSVTGKLLWLQELMLLDEQSQAIFARWRRMSGVSPTYAEGMLICPTSTGDLVAVDLTQRTLAWIYQGAQRTNQHEIFNTPLASMMNSDTGGLAPGSVWSEDIAVVSNGHVLYASPETDKLYCLELLTGKLKWSIPRQQNLFVGGVLGDQVILIGKQNVTCLSLNDKKPIWKAPLTLPNGSLTSGRGFISGAAYYLPVSSGEVLKIDLATGTSSPRGKSTTRSIPGNLICYQGYVVSLGVDRVEKFPQSELLKGQVDTLLAKNSSDWQALAWRGEIAIDENRYAEALQDLKTARSQLKLEQAKGGHDARQASVLNNAAEHLRSLLFNLVASQIQGNLKEQSSQLAELESLIVSNEDRSTWLRLSATASQELGESNIALNKYLELANLQSTQQGLEEIDLQYEVRRDAWLRARLSLLWKNASAADQKVWQELLAARLNKSAGQESKQVVQQLRNFIQLFDFHPLADQARERLLLALGSEQPLHSELLLKSLEKSADPTVQRRVLARLASLYQAQGKHQVSANYYRLLRERYADQECLEGQTGQQWYDSVPKDSAVGKLLAGEVAWPAGLVEEVKVNKKTTSERAERNGNEPMLIRVDMRQAANSPLLDCSLLFDSNNSQLLLRDAVGSDLYRLNLQDNRGLEFGINAAAITAIAHEHLLVVNLGWRIMAFDLMQTSSEANRRSGFLPQLWHYDFADPNVLQMQAQAGNNVMNFADQKIWGISKRRMTNGNTNQSYGAVAIAGRRGVAVQRQREVSLLDPLTGEVLWTRRGLSPDVDLAADDQHLVLLPKSGQDATVLSANDGEVIRSHRLPGREALLHTVGTSILAAVSQGEKSQLQLINSVTGEKQNLGEYSASTRQGAKAAILDDAVAVASVASTPNTGLFEVFDLRNGKRLLATPFPHEGNLQEIAVIRNAEQYLLCIHQGDKQRQNLKYNFQVGYHDGMNNQLWTGTVHAFDRTTGVAMWPTPATFYRHSIWPTQPNGSPALIFVRMANLNNRGGNQLISVLALDKRTGRMIYQRDDLNGQTHGMDIRIDLPAQQIKFQFPSNDGNGMGRLTLAYTDKPRAPEPPYQESLSPGNTPEPAASSPGGLLRAIFGSSSRAQPQPKQVEEAPIAPQVIPVPAPPGNDPFGK